MESTGNPRAGIRPPGAAENILGALTALAAVAFVIIQVLGGVRAESFNAALPIGELAAVYAALVTFAAVNWVIAARRAGIRAMARAGLPTALAVMAAGLAVFAILAAENSPESFAGPAGILGAATAVTYLLFWTSQAGRVRPFTRAASVVLYFIFCVSAGASLGQAQLWKGALVQAEEKPAAPVAVEGERKGKGTDVSFQRVAVGEDWRDAAVMKPGGFFFEEVSISTGDELAFSASRTDDAKGTIAVTVVTPAAKVPVWQADCTSLATDKWTDMSAPLQTQGLAKVVFEFNGPAGAVSIANYRVETGATVGSAAARASGIEHSRNVILLVVDALRADRLSLYGYNRATSPEIDKAASNALVFKECISQAPWTKPAVTSIMTSLHPTAHGVEAQENVLPADMETLASVFQKAGYGTAAIQTNPTLEVERGFAQGFDVYKLFRLRSPTPEEPGGNPRADVANKAALTWLDANSNRPFFLYVHYMETHSPYWPPAEYRTWGDESSDLYDGAINYFSREFAKLYAELARRGMLANTTVILTADHGEQFEEHGETDHGNCVHVEELQVPLIVWSPEIRDGRWVQERVRSIDIAPTLTDLAGVEGLAGRSGESFATAVRGEAIEGREAESELLTYRTTGFKYVSIRGDKWHFIYELNTHTPELYDRVNDPGEKTNLAASQAAAVNDLTAKVKDFQETQIALGKKISPWRKKIPLSQEEIDKLTALGYLGKGAGAGQPAH